MKYLILMLLFTCSRSLAQNHKQRIEQYLDEYKKDFIENSNSPLGAKDLKNLNFFPIDSTYSVMAKIELLPDEAALKFPTSAGTIKKYIRYAKAKFNLKGKELTLTLFKSEIPSQNPKYKAFLFLPFTDETNAKATYGGGRYIDISSTDIKDGLLEIDFNKAYNPYCAYSNGYQCPIPPEENDLAIEVKAGEKLYSGKKKGH
jgi:uncharacterized protein (DUF1684 family)